MNPTFWMFTLTPIVLGLGIDFGAAAAPAASK